MSEEGMYVQFPDGEHVRDQIDRAQMALTAIRHGIDSMLDNMSKDDLMSFKILMGQIGDHENVKLAIHFEGQATYALKSKFQVCPGCGVDHDESMRDELDKAARFEKEKKADTSSFEDELSDVLDSKPKLSSDELIEYIHDGRLDPQWIADNLAGYKAKPPVSKLETAMMALYNLDDLWEESPADADDDGFLGFICKSCKIRYSSIQDRMLKPVDECHGCFIKAAHG